MPTFIGDFIWDRNEARDWEEEIEEQQEQHLELMYMHQLYHGIIKKQQYTLRGSKRSCLYGTDYSLLDTALDHGIYKGNLSVLTTIDCGKSNICGFGSCLCPESNYAGHLPMTTSKGKNGKTAKKASYNKFAHICIPMVPEGSVWQQVDHSIMAKTCAKGYLPLLLDSAALVCQYGGIIKIVEVSQAGTTQGSGNKVEIAPWLFGYEGKPSGAGARSVTYSASERQKLQNIAGVAGIDWYSFENQSGSNIYTSPYLTGRTFNDKKYGENELTDENERYWITLGPKVLIPSYPDTGKLDTDEFGKSGLIGCRVDVVLYNAAQDKYVYIECTWSGNLKAHTYDNGVYQTGHPFPNSHSATAEPYKVEYVDGSIIEFTGKQPSDNGTMSAYTVHELLVYP